jgi:PAS domain S-box-containing protein
VTHEPPSGELLSRSCAGSDPPLPAPLSVPPAPGNADGFFRTLVEHSSDLILILDAQGRIRFHSPAVERVMGWTSAKLIGACAFALIHPQDEARARESFARLTATEGAAAELEFRFRSAAGGWRALSSHVTTLLEHPEVRGVLVTARDVTTRHVAEAALLASEARLQRQNLALVHLAREQSPDEATWEESVRRITATAARTLDVARVSLWLLDAERRTLSCVDGYDADGRCHGFGTEIAVETVPEYLRALGEARTLAADRLDRHPGMRGFREAASSRVDASAALDAAVRLGGEVVGVVCLEHHGAPRPWTLDEQGFAGSIADMAAVALQWSERRVSRELNRRLASIVEASDDAIFSLSPIGTILSWNPGAERVYGYAAPEIIGGSVTRLFAAGPASAELLLLERLERGEPVQNHDTVHLHRSGRPVDVSLTLSAIRNADGRITSTAAVARDISARRHAEQALERLRRRNQLLLESAGDGILGLDADGHITFVNPAAARMLEREPAELIGCAWVDLRRSPDAEGSHPPAGASASHFDATSDHKGEERLLRRGGAPLLVEYTCTPVQEGGRVVGAVLTFRDVTARKETEAALVRAKEMAEAASRTKSDFLSRMSHELRTPLNSVIGFARVLNRNRDERLTPAELRYLERILANGTHLLGLINAILDLSRIEAGEAAVDRTEVALPELIRDAVDSLATQVGAAVEIVTRVPDRAAPVEADAVKWKQILDNVVGNALKFTERGSVTVELHVDPRTARPLRVEVRDTGIGIPAERLPHVFHAFHQGEDGTARRYGGTGLGLTITERLCELMGYGIEIRSEVGEGTTVTVLLEEPPGRDARTAAEPAGPTLDPPGAPPPVRECAA